MIRSWRPRLEQITTFSPPREFSAHPNGLMISLLQLNFIWRSGGVRIQWFLFQSPMTSSEHVRWPIGACLHSATNVFRVNQSDARWRCVTKNSGSNWGRQNPSRKLLKIINTLRGYKTVYEKIENKPSPADRTSISCHFQLCKVTLHLSVLLLPRTFLPLVEEVRTWVFSGH